MPDFPIFPEQASTIGAQIDWIFFTLIGLSLLFGLPVVGLIITFAIRYRRGSRANRVGRLDESNKLEFTWTFIPFVVAMAIFGWSAVVYYNYATPPGNALEIYVIGKQWMWYAQHPSGKTEINALHVPLGRPVKLIMTSQDVIHSFYIPAFRVKQDVLPGRYTTLWFEATKTGDYHLFCAEYCGTDHAKMTGTVTVMEPDAYQAWLGGVAEDESMADAGQRLFQQRGCMACHNDSPNSIGPNLAGTFGEPVQLTSGETIMVDEAYLLESIRKPQEKVVAGYAPLMPTYQGILTEQEILQLVEYIKSLESR
ncbi:MAG: cytochrome c oxidase subunit II [Anaerolineae bacterium]|nr:cytochrome c oxidase subunit II [Anaerolineae bacterium]